MKKLSLFLLVLAIAATSITGCKKKPKPTLIKTDGSTVTCGDGTKADSEECDDGNTTSGDGCSDSCALEQGFTCATPGKPCVKEPPAQVDTCGDSEVTGSETCDDGNTLGGDGCGADCQIEDNTWECSTPGQPCTKKQGKVFASDQPDTCGNGKVDHGETCDDGNLVGGDGCTALCQIEQDWSCLHEGEDCTYTNPTGKCGDGTVDGAEECDPAASGAPANCLKNCKLSTCGNGKKEVGETCDDGNVTDGDGCSADCKLESGYLCDPRIGCKRANCGDGKLDPGTEECDDGAAANVGGYGKCRPDCRKAPHCGDGFWVPSKEECDDGNDQDNDGCSHDCKVETLSPGQGRWVCVPGQACKKDNCGNGNVESGEQCDDANNNDGDGCSANCLLEYGYACGTPGQPCTAKKCGDGALAGTEECDDGNLRNNDGCNQYCEIEYGWVCPTPGKLCVKPQCGDSSVNGAEECDDGNTNPNDGCSANCTIEKGYKCPTPGQPCVLSVCGDGKKEGYETCDIGTSTNATDKAACQGCQVQSGYGCKEDSTGKSSCHKTLCGDGIVDGDEECDDGNRLGGDGCDPFCKAESIYHCRVDSTGKRVCGPVCGDGITIAGEECDDGNRNAGDGCSPDCKQEPGFTCTSFSSTSNPKKIKIPVVIRDFKGADLNGGHPDFESSACGRNTGYLKHQLDKDGKPELTAAGSCYAGNGKDANGNAVHLSADEAFYYWFHDNDFNDHSLPNKWAKRVEYVLELEQDPSDSSGSTYKVSKNPDVKPKNFTSPFTANFFPIDGEGWNSDKIPAGDREKVRNGNHNFSFTDEFTAYFKYTGGATLLFTGDDDLWVFVNGELALDQGGLRNGDSGTLPISEQINPDTNQKYDPKYGLYEGGIYPIKVFHAERHTSRSQYELTLKGFVNTGTSVCVATCGDGQVAYGYEECDLGSKNSDATNGSGQFTSGCSSTCKINKGWFCSGSPSVCSETTCGDGKVQYPEECDDAKNGDDNDGCNDDCRLTKCNDGTKQASEACDKTDPHDPNHAKCSDKCQIAKCGNGIAEAPLEECDDGNKTDNDGCTNDCKLPVCGDGIVQTAYGEVCDDGHNTGNYGSCTADCQGKAPFCGDGIIQTTEGEVCDDGVNNGLVGVVGGCKADCKGKTTYCGDGNVDPDETCDDGNDQAGDGCDESCRPEPGYSCVTTSSGLSSCSRLG